MSLDAIWVAYPWLNPVTWLLGLMLLSMGLRAVLLWVLRQLSRRFAGTLRSQSLPRVVATDDKVIRRVAQWAAPLVFMAGLNFIPSLHPGMMTVVRNVASAVMVLAIARLLLAVLDALLTHHQQASQASAQRQRSIKSYVQLAQLLICLACGVIMVATLADKSPVIVVSGLGAMSAVLMLVFKDTILSFTAGVQLSSNDLLRVGDWIEMPQVGADGAVIDIALNTVKVQNWDKTITVVPTWRLMSESYKNWRGMSESGGRRIKRALMLDAGSVRFLRDDEVMGLAQIELLEGYLRDKHEAVTASRQAVAARLGEVRGNVSANARKLTNIGTFRAYALAYLRAHAEIHQDMMVMVRMQQPTPEGIPVELYCFTATTAWVEYERIQGDIFDHLIAVLPEFGLRPYQKPSGMDIKWGIEHVARLQTTA